MTKLNSIVNELTHFQYQYSEFVKSVKIIHDFENEDNVVEVITNYPFDREWLVKELKFVASNLGLQFLEIQEDVEFDDDVNDLNGYLDVLYFKLK